MFAERPRKLTLTLTLTRRLQEISAASSPLRHRNVSTIAADWALPGGKSYPKRPIGYRTRAELTVALQASGLPSLTLDPDPQP